MQQNVPPLHVVNGSEIQNLLSGSAQPPESSDVLMRVPPEIFHSIFQNLRKDKKTLSSCSYVSQYYRQLSMPWLFAYIEVRSLQHLANFTEFVSIHLGLGSYVEQLDFYGYDYPSEPLVAHPEHTIRAVISSAISALPSLEFLSLYCISFDIETNPTSVLPLADTESEAQRTRHKLQLCISGHADTPSWTPILTWLLSRYTVDTLCLSGVLISPIEDLNSALGVDRLRRTSQIPCLAIDLCANVQNDPYSLLGTLLRPGSLRTVCMLCVDHFSASRILFFVRTTGRNVTYLSLDIAFLSVEEDHRDQARSWAVLGETLTCCPRLLTLCIRMSVFSMHDYSGLPRHAVFTTIVPCASRSLRTLTIALAKGGLWNHTMNNVETWDLPALAEYLTKEPAAFPYIRNVYVELRLRNSNEQRRACSSSSAQIVRVERCRGIARVLRRDDSDNSYGFGH